MKKIASLIVMALLCTGIGAQTSRISVLQGARNLVIETDGGQSH